MAGWPFERAYQGMNVDTEAIQDIEIQLLIEALRLRYGYDFRDYADASLKRRILRCLSVCDFKHVSEIIPRLLHEGWFLNRLIHELSVTVTEMFRNPSTYKTLVERVFPVLKTYPFFNVWHAGCATGEEVYSLAILLKEAGLYDRSRIYATDLNPEAIRRAKEGIYSLDRLQIGRENYRLAGGGNDFSTWCHAGYDLIRMDSTLRENMVFATHNLATDGVFAEVHLILCRNVLIYFEKELKERSLVLFRDSLVSGGFLCLGNQESLPMAEVSDHFVDVVANERLFRKQVWAS